MIFVVARNEQEFNRFGRETGLKREQVRRLSMPEHARGLRGSIVIVLEGLHYNRGIDELLEVLTILASTPDRNITLLTQTNQV